MSRLIVGMNPIAAKPNTLSAGNVARVTPTRAQLLWPRIDHALPEQVETPGSPRT
ncbi:MAG: hypothetical protein M3Q89_01720 [Verrucomicrobiota bacterium]|nr:hypothetical protein [Verrucomicrobiota bacterium]